MTKFNPESAPAIHRQLALKDAIELLSGKWKIIILQGLYLYGALRFKDLIETSKRITPCCRDFAGYQC